MELTKSQAQQLMQLQQSKNFQPYQEILMELRSEAERRAFSNPKEAYEDIIIRNTIDMILNKPQRLIEQLRERLKIESFDLPDEESAAVPYL